MLAALSLLSVAHVLLLPRSGSATCTTAATADLPNSLLHGHCAEDDLIKTTDGICVSDASVPEYCESDSFDSYISPSRSVRCVFDSQDDAFCVLDAPGLCVGSRSIFTRQAPGTLFVGPQTPGATPSPSLAPATGAEGDFSGSGRPPVTATKVAAADLTGDGLVDIVAIGNSIGAGTLSFRYWRNVGSPTVPAMERADHEITAAPELRLYSYGSPALVDLTGDFLLDLVVATVYGELLLFRNNGTVVRPDFVMVGEPASTHPQPILPCCRQAKSFSDKLESQRVNLLRSSGSSPNLVTQPILLSRIGGRLPSLPPVRPSKVNRPYMGAHESCHAHDRGFL